MIGEKYFIDGLPGDLVKQSDELEMAKLTDFKMLERASVDDTTGFKIDDAKWV